MAGAFLERHLGLIDADGLQQYDRSSILKIYLRPRLPPP